MADSVIGSTTGVDGLDQATKDKLGTAGQDFLSGITGNVAVVPLGDSTFVGGSDGTGGNLGKLIASPNLPTDGALSNDLSVHTPAKVGLFVQGPSAPQATYQTNDYFAGLANDTWKLDDGAYKDSFNTAVARASHSAGNNATVSLFTPDDQSAVAGEMTLTGSATLNEVAVINMYGVQAHTAVNVSDFNSVVMLGGGTLNLTGGSAFVSGDAANQKITGGTGNDTLVGGGGSDILTGGSGADTFGVDLTGDLLITDFGAGDMLSFGGGMTLEKFVTMDVTSFTQLGGFAVTDLAFEGHHVYLVGVEPSALTLDMINFDL